MTVRHGARESIIDVRFGRPRAGSGGSDVCVEGCPVRRVVAHLAPVRLPGVALIVDPAAVALSLLWQAGVPWRPDLPPVRRHTTDELAALRERLDRPDAPTTTSMAMLLDGLGALAGDDGGAWDQAEVDGAYWFQLQQCRPVLVDPDPVVRAAAADVTAGVPAGVVMARVRDGLADVVTRLAVRFRGQVGPAAVRLAGSVFDRPGIGDATTRRLRQAGFPVHGTAVRPEPATALRPARG